MLSSEKYYKTQFLKSKHVVFLIKSVRNYPTDNGKQC